MWLWHFLDGFFLETNIFCLQRNHISLAQKIIRHSNLNMLNIAYHTQLCTIFVLVYKQLACVFPYFLFSYDVITTLGHKRLCTVLEMMSLYSWVVRPWRPHRYEGPHHSTQDLKCICQIRDNDLIYMTNCLECPKSGGPAKLRPDPKLC